MTSETITTCETCRDFVIQGYSDQIEDMGQHIERDDAISSIVNGRTIDAHAEKLLDQFKPCDVCDTICDTLFPITLTAMTSHQRNLNLLRSAPPLYFLQEL